MNISPHSDLHAEHRGYDAAYPAIPACADAIVLAGDLCGSDTPDWIKELSARNPGKPIIWVAGNHEFYGAEHEPTLANFRRIFDGDPDIHFLENEEVLIGGVRFLGMTLWTDFMGSDLNKNELEISLSRLRYEFRRMGRGRNRIFTAEHIAGLQRESVQWLKDKLNEPWEGKTVVISHFAPFRDSPHPYFGHNSYSSPYFSNNLDDLPWESVDAWIYGHNHANASYMKNGIQVVSNQAGYPGEPMASCPYQEDLIITI